jgi:hypothetical protein
MFAAEHTTDSTTKAAACNARDVSPLDSASSSSATKTEDTQLLK